MRSRRILEALRRRVLTLAAQPEALARSTVEQEGGYAIPTFYTACTELGLLTEPEGRAVNNIVAKYNHVFEGRDIVKSVVATVDKTVGYPYAEREAALKPFIVAYTSGENITKFNPTQLLYTVKMLASVRGHESNAEEPMLELKNFLTSHLATRMPFMSKLEVCELMTVMSKQGKSCLALTPAFVTEALEHMSGCTDCAGPVAGSLARATRYMTLPNPICEEYVKFAFQSAMDGKCGPQHQVTVLRALVMLDKYAPKEYNGEMSRALLAKIRESGMLNLDGPNLGMMMGVLSHLKLGSDPILDTLVDAMLPQVQACNPTTLAAILKNAGNLRLALPPRVSVEAVRKVIEFIPQEDPSNIIVMLQGASRCTSQSRKARSHIMEAITILVNTTGDSLVPEDWAALTRVLARVFGSYRSSDPSIKDAIESIPVAETVLMSEIDLETLEYIMMRVMTIPKEETWAIIELVRNLAELGIDYEELRPLARSIIANPGQIDSRVLARLIRALQLANCTDTLLIRALGDSARRSRQTGLIKLADEVIAQIGGR